MANWVFWLIIILFLAVLEVLTVNLVSIWFIASAMVSLVISFFVDSFYIQFLVFGVLGIILMITTRPLLNKYIKPKTEKTNLDRVIGMHGVVTEEIKRNVVGEVKVDGKRWSAIATKKISVGEEVVIEAIDGVKLKVRKEDINGN